MLENSHILITGANGFVGWHLGKALLGTGARVSQIARLAPPDGRAADTWHILDLTDRIKVAEVFASLQPDYVIHLASSKRRGSDIGHFRNVYDTNLSISLNVIDACRALSNFERLVFLGTCDEYGLARTPYDETHREVPTTAYGLAKLAITQILMGLFHSHRFPSVVLRPTVIYGQGQGEEMFLPALIQALLAGKDFAMTAGEQRRDFIHVNDVVEAIIKAITADERANGTVVNIGTGVSYRIREIAIMVADTIGPDARELIRFGAVQYRPNEVMDYSVAINRAQVILGWSPSTRLEDGVRQTVGQYKVSASNCSSRDRNHA